MSTAEMADALLRVRQETAQLQDPREQATVDQLLAWVRDSLAEEGVDFGDVKVARALMAVAGLAQQVVSVYSARGQQQEGLLQVWNVLAMAGITAAERHCTNRGGARGG